jgi:hypothetical protein
MEYFQKETVPAPDQSAVDPFEPQTVHEPAPPDLMLTHVEPMASSKRSALPAPVLFVYSPDSGQNSTNEDHPKGAFLIATMDMRAHSFITVRFGKCAEGDSHLINADAVNASNRNDVVPMFSEVSLILLGFKFPKARASVLFHFCLRGPSITVVPARAKGGYSSDETKC